MSTVSDIWHEAVAHACAYEPIVPYADEAEARVARRQHAVFRAMVRIRDAGLAVEVLYSPHPAAASKTYYKAVGTVGGYGSVQSFDENGHQRPSYAWMVNPLEGMFGTVVPEAMIYDLQDPA